MKRMHCLFLYLLIALFFARPLFAQQPPVKTKPVKLLIEAALELGGDDIAEVYFTNGESQSVKAGQGGSLGVGAQFRLGSQEKFLLRTSLGIKYLTTQADNAHIRLTRFPIHIAAHWMVTRKLRIGAGLATHRSITFKTDGLGGDMDFQPATGPLFEVAYSIVGLRYIPMIYKDKANNSYSANAIGLTLSFTIPNK